MCLVSSIVSYNHSMDVYLHSGIKFLCKDSQYCHSTLEHSLFSHYEKYEQNIISKPVRIITYTLQISYRGLLITNVHRVHRPVYTSAYFEHIIGTVLSVMNYAGIKRA